MNPSRVLLTVACHERIEMNQEVTGDGDASTQLARDWALAKSQLHPQLAQEISENTPCDRCGGAFPNGVYRIQHGHVAGVLATWFVCARCDAALTEWIATGPAPGEISAT